MKVRPLRGQVVIRPDPPQPSEHLWTPTPAPRSTTTHRGVVLALGAPALTPTGAPVPHGFQVGDMVQYHFTHLEEAATNSWDGAPAHWIPQQNIDAVWENS